MDDDKLYIPYGLSIDQEYFPGFGGRWKLVFNMDRNVPER